MFKLLVILSVIVAICGAETALRSVEDISRDVTVVELIPGQKLRAYEARWFPLVNPRAIQLRGIAAERRGREGTLDVVEFDLTTILQTALAFGYFHAESDIPSPGENGTASVSASLFAFAMRAFAVFEYVERNNEPGYQRDSTDNITGLYDLSNAALTWKPMKINSTVVTDAQGKDHKVFYITIETLDEVFLLRFIVSGAPIEVEGVKLTPDSIKIDIAIRWFTDLHVPQAWTTGPSDVNVYPLAQVGLACAMAALAGTANVNAGTASTQPSLEFAAGGYNGYFSWAERADVVVQGATVARAVRAQIVDTANNVEGSFMAGWVIKGMFFSFEGNRPQEVVWDPEVGARIDYDSSSSSMKPMLFIIFALLAIFA